MFEESSDFSFDGTIKNIKEFSKHHNILHFGHPQKGHSEIQLSDSEIESYENQYLLAHVIK